MRILHVILSADPKRGGPIAAVVGFSLAHIASGHCAEVVCGDAPGASWLAEFPMPCHPLGPSKGTLRFGRKLIPWLLKHAGEYDMVVVHGIWRYHTIAARQASRNPLIGSSR